jgi:hypothetical protein
MVSPRDHTIPEVNVVAGDIKLPTLELDHSRRMATLIAPR